MPPTPDPTVPASGGLLHPPEVEGATDAGYPAHIAPPTGAIITSKTWILALCLSLTACDSSSGDGDETEEGADSTDGSTGADGAGGDCPGGQGEAACCEAGEELCGTSLTGEECCVSETQTCATCWDGDEEFTVCLEEGEDCGD